MIVRIVAATGRRLPFSASALISFHNVHNDATLDSMRARRRWIAAFEQTTLTTDQFPIAFSRSSGPGGQNVNKLNTKATVRLDLARTTRSDGDEDDKDGGGNSSQPGTIDLSPGKKWLPKTIASELVAQSPYYVQSSHSVAISSMRHRTAPANAQDALEKLHEHILSIASSSLVGETSAQQRDRVKGLERRESRKMEKVKRQRSNIKAGRGKVAL
ncbi:hypothetical protein CF326_g2052 [Tilletia indica]|nr:hypothetical protein CF326_g2052 [Tilletia indica]